MNFKQAEEREVFWITICKRAKLASFESFNTILLLFQYYSSILFCIFSSLVFIAHNEIMKILFSPKRRKP